ncbi:MAG: hypothetical protein DWQ01_03140 [Planctomycetota bacterium]|nr:MAG: hypothetical protein DWQ01_03140 [Planctomycetota bacterium]
MRPLPPLYQMGAGLVTGVTGAALLQAFTFPGLDPLELFRVKFLITASGNLMAAALVLALLILVRLWKPASPRVMVCFWLGFTLGAGPWITSTWGTTWAQNHGPTSLLGKPVIYGYATMLLGFSFTRLLAGWTQWARPLVVWSAPVLLGLYLLFWSLPDGTGTQDRPFLPDGPEVEGLQISEEHPDLILISVDTLRADSILAQELNLPHLDRLRARGRWAPYGLAPAPSTVPSHTTMLTGADILTHGARSNEFMVPDRLPVVAELLKDAGYRTAAVVSSGVLHGAGGFRRGFQVYDDSSVAAAAAVTPLRRMADKKTMLGWFLPELQTVQFVMRLCVGREQWHPGNAGSARGERTQEVSSEYLTQLQSGRAPYFFFLHFMDPHLPYTPHESTLGSLVQPEDIPEAYRLHNLGSQPQVRSVQAGLQQGDPLAEQAAEALKRLYLEEVLYIDACIGALMDQADASGRPTAILFTSDHGEHFGEHDLMLHANSLYEPLLQVPFVLMAPGLAPDSSFPVVPRLEDVAPTLLGLAGVQTSSFMKGRNLTEEVFEPSPQWAAYGKRNFSFRDGPWKLIGRVQGDGFEAQELYHLENDPEESENLLDQEPEVVSRLRLAAMTALQGARPGSRGEVDDWRRQMLNQLGYGEEEDEEEEGL